MEKPIIRLVTCGSVDDGKSTLIGRLLVETDSVPTTPSMLQSPFVAPAQQSRQARLTLAFLPTALRQSANKASQLMLPTDQ